MSERVKNLLDACDSELERRFVEFLRMNDHRLPDSAQELLADQLARPDFIYRLPSANVAVFIDGPHHDDAHITTRDLQAEYRLEDAGWLVVRFRYDDAWDQIARKNPNVFGPGRGTN